MNQDNNNNININNNNNNNNENNNNINNLNCNNILNDTNIRRSKRLAAKDENNKTQLIDSLMADFEREDSASNSLASVKKTVANLGKKKVYRSSLSKQTTNKRDEDFGTLFDQGRKAVAIIGATSVDDHSRGTSDICYLIKYDNGQFELVLNTVAHKFCPMVYLINDSS